MACARDVSRTVCRGFHLPRGGRSAAWPGLAGMTEASGRSTCRRRRRLTGRCACLCQMPTLASRVPGNQGVDRGKTEVMALAWRGDPIRAHDGPTKAQTASTTSFSVTASKSIDWANARHCRCFVSSPVNAAERPGGQAVGMLVSLRANVASIAASRSPSPMGSALGIAHRSK